MDRQKIYANNKTFLNKNYPSLASSFCDRIPDDIEILPTRKGSLTLKVQGTLLHSMFDPQKEAQRFAEGNSINQGNTIVLYGLGLGYHVLEIARRLGPSGRLIVVEMNAGIIRAALEVIDLTELVFLTQCELIFPASKNDFKNLSELVDNDRCNVLVHQVSLKCIPSKYKEVGMMFESTLIQNRTAGVFKKQYAGNFEKNIDTVLSYPGIAEVKNALAGRPAMLIGAGPSLDDSIAFIKQYSQRAIVMAVDTAFPILMNQGIRPDFVVSVDPQDITFKHFRGYENAGVPILVTPVSCSQLMQSYKGPFMIFLQKNHSFTGVMESVLGAKGFSYAGGSVSCIAFDILSQWRCSPVMFVGMDYAYPLSRAYSRLSFESIQMFNTINRFYTQEVAQRRRINVDKPVYVESYNGTQVQSSITLCDYRKNIENLVALHQENVTTYSVSACGARMKNVQLLPAQKINTLLPEKLNKSFCITASPVDAVIKQQLLCLCGR